MIKEIKDSRSIIIDLRENNGGSPDSVELLCSYFLEAGVELSSIRNRGDQDTPTGLFKTLQYNAIPEKDRLLETPIYILTSSETFSAAEKFANDMQIIGRGIIVGENTKGGANPGDRLSWGEFLDRDKQPRMLDVNIPMGETINLRGKANWEGVGVTPDQPISADDALEKALELITKG